MPRKFVIDYAESLGRLRRGDIPIRATQRLREEAGPNRKLFTSDLTTNEHLLARQANVTPISQVMGSSIYHIGKIPDYKGKTGEIAGISKAHREARELALSRLRIEAKLVGADVVLGVHLGERLITKGSHGKGGDDGDEVIEFTVVGTAAKAPWIPNYHKDPITTDLSGQDLWALAHDGWAPCGMVFDFCRYHVWHVMDTSQWTAGDEIRSATQGVDAARRIVAGRVADQANYLGADYVVGSDLRVEVNEVPCGWEGCKLDDVDIDIVWYATGIRRLEGIPVSAGGVPPLILGMMPLGKKKRGELLEGMESEDEELKSEAKEDEEKALEEDGGGE